MRPSPITVQLSLQNLKSLCLVKIDRYLTRLNITAVQPYIRKMAAKAPTQITTLPHLPELYNPGYLDVLLPPPSQKSATAGAQDASTAVPKNPMMDALMATTNRKRTQNNAKAFRSTNDKLLDAFHRPQADFTQNQLDELFTPAWDADSGLTLRTIFYLRSIHEGKNDRNLFYRAWAWLYANHPRTAIYNLRQLVEQTCYRKPRKSDGKQLPGYSHGYWKDLLNILCLASANKLGKEDHFNLGNGVRLTNFRGVASREQRAGTGHKALVERLSGDAKYRALYVTVARLFAERLAEDTKLMYELEGTSDAEAQSNLRWQISLAGKWAPTPGCAHDRLTNISTAIVQLLHSDRGSHSWQYPSALTTFDHTAPLPTKQAEVLRSYFQRWFLTPLRAVQHLPEPMMAAGKWSQIKYNRVASVCMQNNTRLFFKHDQERFTKYMKDVEERKSTISGATLLPHEIVMRIVKYDHDRVVARHDLPEEREYKEKLLTMQLNVAMAQWGSLVDRLRESGTLDNAIAICDVSGSMGTLWYDFETKMKKRPDPIFPAVAMSILLASLAKPPFNNGFITFSADPEFIRLSDDKTFAENVSAMGSASWGMNTDLRKVFTKLLLPLAKQNNVKKEDMIKRLFVFSDMQFDEADDGRHGDDSSWDTTYDVIKRDYEAAGYDMPEIVYWDLGSFDTVETPADRKGVAMMRGFSASMMKVFLGEEQPEEEQADEDIVLVDEKDGDVVMAEEPSKAKEAEEFTPMTIMRKALMRKSFDGLVILD
ncbi:hypothetical protein Dda_9028 [Drechslerella dactyloides]|uniref:Uncharacterized protein n=1 Tax=Drechslerella dactyloides TaxID=74499 RepID=A0AAD6NGY2_DREDA|nr:hypothetical protein Dda_9028 [Drechslerella dactyloides]